MTETSTALQLVITDARREFEESGKVRNLPFWVYLITCKTTLQKYRDSVVLKNDSATSTTTSDNEQLVTVKIWRRYSDFQWLRTTLLKSFGGHIIPPIPEKDIAGTMDKVTDLVSGKEEEDWKSNNLISLRLRGLNNFVQYLGRCSVAETDIVRNFLCMNRFEEWQAYKQQVNENIKLHRAHSDIGFTARAVWGKMKDIVSAGSTTNTKHNDIESNKLFLDPRIVRIQSQSREFEENMIQIYQTSLSLLTHTKHRSSGDPIVYDSQSRAKEIIPLWLLSVGHKVCGVECHVGVVRYVGPIDSTSTVLVGVEWPEETIGDTDGTAPDGQRYFQTKTKCASFVSPQVVFYPSNGISDPVILAAREATTQIETHMLPYGNRVQQLLTELVDMTYFWRMYASALIEIISSLEALESDRKRFQEEVNKETRADKQQLIRKKLEAAVKNLKEYTDIFHAQFQSFFLPEHRRAMRKILEIYVTVQKDICSSGSSWTGKMKPITSLLDAHSGGDTTTTGN